MVELVAQHAHLVAMACELNEGKATWRNIKT
ncbi:MAG: hypothetical protein RLZZ24_1469, partial [Pseudomonadota bacterium]